MRRRTAANICKMKKYKLFLMIYIFTYLHILHFICNIINDYIYFLVSHIFAVVLRRIAVLLLSNLFTYHHCKHPRIRRAKLVSCPFLFRFIFSAMLSKGTKHIVWASEQLVHGSLLSDGSDRCVLTVFA